MAVPLVSIATTILAAIFATIVLRRFATKGGTHLLWWGGGIAVYGLATAAEAYVGLFGFHAGAFRTWYVAGALLGGYPLAQGTVYLLAKRRTADALAAVTLVYAALAVVAILLSPLDESALEGEALSGHALVWGWVRLLTIFPNSYALVFLVGGAVVSAWRLREAGARDRFIGNLAIAAGGLFPALGGTLSRFGVSEALAVTLFLGLVLIFAGFTFNVKARGTPRAAAAPAPAVDPR